MKITKEYLKQIIKEEIEEAITPPPPPPQRPSGGSQMTKGQISAKLMQMKLVWNQNKKEDFEAFADKVNPKSAALPRNLKTCDKYINLIPEKFKNATDPKVIDEVASSLYFISDVLGGSKVLDSNTLSGASTLNKGIESYPSVMAVVKNVMDSTQAKTLADTLRKPDEQKRLAAPATNPAVGSFKKPPPLPPKKAAPAAPQITTESLKRIIKEEILKSRR